MNSLVVLFALVAAATAAPHVSPVVAYEQPAPVAYVVPSAVSSQSRVDVHNTPAVYAASPVVTEVAGAPAFYAANNFYGAQVAPGYGGYYAPGFVPQQYVAPGFVHQAYAPGTVFAY